jgi:glycosyltransferase involved in cell wall biosynthesis
MLKSDINFFEYIDNFKKTSNIDSKLIYGEPANEAPLISIVIPTYKCKPSVLKETLDSALGQAEFHNYEIILIDNNPEINCSTQQLIESYNNKKIIYYKNNENIGMFGNWNRGAKLSDSEWVVFLHDDDIMSPYFLVSCFTFLKDQSIGILKPLNTKFSDSNKVKFEKPRNLKIERLRLIDFIWGCEIGAPTNIIYNKNALFEIGGFNNDFFPSADYVVAINFVKKYSVYRVPFELGGYRVGENESLNPNTMKMFYQIRFQITTFIMRKLRLPFFLIESIQSALMPSLIINTNNYYDTKIPYDYCKELEIKPTNRFKQSIIKKIFVMLRYSLAIKRKLMSNVNHLFKNKL